MDKIKITNDYWKVRAAKKNYTKQQGGVVRNVVSVFSAFLLGYIVSNAIDISTLITWVSNQWAQAQVSDQDNTSLKTDMAQKQDTPKPKFEFYTLLAKDNHVSTQTHQFASVEPQKVLAIENKPVAAAAVPSDEANDLLSNAPSVEEELASRTHGEEAHTVRNNDAPTMPRASMHPEPPEQQPISTKQARPVVSVQEEQANIRIDKKSPLASRETYMIQVAAVTRRPDAEHLKRTLAAKGYSVMIISPDNKAGWFRVVVGPFHSRADASQIQDKIGRTEHIQGMIRKVDI